MSDFGSQFNYKQLLEHHDLIRVPMIQRDYAQGRESVAQVRDDFLAAIETALKSPPGDPSLPMNLDFIYGSVVEFDERSLFAPLDGQQRLTTLFLLHWYLAWADKRFAEFTELFRDGEHSRFSYSVRQSSNEFFDALVQCQPPLCPQSIPLLSGWIANQQWYFRNWRLDPTIKSVLSMLDAIHARFASSSGLFARLIDVEHPAITFQLLDLENFGLSDDLYIKMNARGKPLTPLETFKARYEQVLENQFLGKNRRIGVHEFPIHEFVARRMDTTWLDLFWASNRQAAQVVDESMFNVFRLLALVTRDPSDKACLKHVTALTKGKPDYAAFHDNGWLDESFSQTLIALLERWTLVPGRFCAVLPNANYFDETALFKKVKADSTSLDVSETLLFMAYALFIREHEGDLNVEQMNEWLRVIHNLVINSNIDRTDRIPSGMSVILSLLPNADRILEHLQAWEVPDGFPVNIKHQTEEEILKAKLLLGDDGWRPLIHRAELHGYFRGQIEFLLEFCKIGSYEKESAVAKWDKSMHNLMQRAFACELAKAEAMFDSRGLISSHEHHWERALLAVGNYLLEVGNLNCSLLVNSITEQGSWKRFLRGFSSAERKARGHLRELWSRLDNAHEYEIQLLAIIDSMGTDVEPWRRAIATTPQVFKYGIRRMLRFSANGNIYLLKKLQMNGAHVELNGFCFFHNQLSTIASKGILSPFEIGSYEPVNTADQEPFFSLRYREEKQTIDVEVDYVDGEYRVGVDKTQLAKAPLLETCMERHGPFVDVEHTTCILVAPTKLQQVLTAIANDLRT